MLEFADELDRDALRMRRATFDAQHGLDTTLEHVATRVVGSVRRQWPVGDTGASRAAWVAVGAAIDNPLQYIEYVHDGLADRLVPAEMARIGDPAVAAYADALVDLALGDRPGNLRRTA